MSGGGSKSSSTNTPQLSPSEMIDLYNKALPPSMATLMNQVPGSVNTLANAATLNNPIFTAGTLDQLAQYSPGFQRAGADLSQMQAQSTADLLRGAGGNAAREAAALANELNPATGAANARVAELVAKPDLSGNLTAGEQNAIERSVNQSNQGMGNLGLRNATNTTANAMQFGNAATQRQQQQFGNLNTALNTANTVASTQNQQFNPVNVALGAGNTAGNFGLGQFNPNQANALSGMVVNAGTGWGSQLAGISSAGTGTSSGSSAQGGLCCFIFMEAYYGQMPKTVRICRDHYYKAFPSIADGYVKMAKWLVPAMQKWSLVRCVVWHTMVKPLTGYGNFVLHRDLTCRKYRWARKFWFTIWHITGGSK